MITQELRDLLKGGAPAEPEMPAKDRTVIAPVTPQKSREASKNLTLVSLRRDGDRPMRFSGQLLYHLAGHWSATERVFDHHVFFYQDEAGSLVAALALHPSEQTPLRPCHWAQAVRQPQALETLLDHWCLDILANSIQAKHPACLSEARAALHSMTAHTLRVAQPHIERKESCLQ